MVVRPTTRSRLLWRTPVVILLAVVLGGCSHAKLGTRAQHPVSSSTEPPGADKSATVVLRPSGPLAAPWRERFRVPFGPGVAELGLGSRPTTAPEYGALDRSGRWWMLDIVKHRIARYSSGGSYIDQLPTPGFRGLDPCVTGDGTFIAPGQPGLVVGAGDHLTSQNIDPQLDVFYSDDTQCWGTDLEGYKAVSAVNGRVEVSPQSEMRSPDGRRFLLSVSQGTVEFSFLDGGVRLVSLSIRQPDGQAVRPSTEFVFGSKGEIFLLLQGVIDPGNGSPRTPLAGLVSIDRDGNVSQADSLPRLDSTVDTGATSILHIAPGGDIPYLLVITQEGAVVYGRDG